MEDMEDMISVIVPIYNAERFLCRALDSLQAQTYMEWEAILVNDGSTDSSSEIALAYVASDRRFRYMDKENSGISDTRNLGVELAKGEYAMFMDSDDFLHPQAMELCMQCMRRDKSDIVAFTYNRRYRTLNIIRHFLHLEYSAPAFKMYNDPDYLVTDSIFDFATEYTHPRHINGKWAVKHCQAWRCLYRTEVIRNIRFISGIVYEDFPWWSEVLLGIKRATILNLPLYYYYPNPQGYVFASEQERRIESLEIAIAKAEALYSNVPEEKRMPWEMNFLVPFKKKLAKKIRKIL